MEQQKGSLLKRKNRWGLTILFAVLSFVLAPFLSITLCIPQIMTVLPIAMMALLAFVGPSSCFVCIGIITAVSAATFGIWGGVAAAVFMLPVVMASVAMVNQEHEFWSSVAASSVTMFTSMGLLVGLVSLLAGQDVVSAFSDIMRQMFDSSGVMGDLFLSILMQSGVLSAVDSAAETAVLDPQTRTELISKLILMMDSVLRLEIPMQMATGAVAAGLFGQAVLRKGLLAQGEKTDYPPMRTWHVPKGWGRVLAGTLAALYLLMLVAARQTSTMFYVFSGVFQQVFALQGIAAACYFLHERGKGRVAQGFVFLLGYFLVRPAALVIGIADQAMDVTHRREKLAEAEKNPFDPRAEQ